MFVYFSAATIPRLKIAILQSAVTVDVSVSLAVCRIFCLFHNCYQRGVSVCPHVATEPPVFLSQPHITKPAGVPVEVQCSVPIRRRAITYIALIVRSFPATPPQIRYSFNPNTGCFVISAAGTKNF